MPTVIESPSATNVVMPASARCEPPSSGLPGLSTEAGARPGSRRRRRASRIARPGPGPRPGGPAPAGPARPARPAARSSPATLAPAAPTTSGSADSALTTTGVPQASASSAASPKVSAGPGRDGHVGAAQQRGQLRAARQEAGERDGQRVARHPALQARAQRPVARHHQPGGQAVPRAGWPAYSASAAASFPATACRSAPAASRRARVGGPDRLTARAEGVQVHAERGTDQVPGADPLEFRGGPGGRADHLR